MIQARCSANIRADVEAGIIPACEPNKCVVGFKVGDIQDISATAWHSAIKEHARSYKSTEKLPPMQLRYDVKTIIPLNFCPKCGRALAEFHKLNPLSEIAANCV